MDLDFPINSSPTIRASPLRSVLRPSDGKRKIWDLSHHGDDPNNPLTGTEVCTHFGWPCVLSLNKEVDPKEGPSSTSKKDHGNHVKVHSSNQGRMNPENPYDLVPVFSVSVFDGPISSSRVLSTSPVPVSLRKDNLPLFPSIRISWAKDTHWRITDPWHRNREDRTNVEVIVDPMSVTVSNNNPLPRGSFLCFYTFISVNTHTYVRSFI